MADGRKNNGGHSTRGKAGRPSKREELKLASKMRNILQDDVLLEKLAKLVKSGDINAIKLWMGYLYGMPTQRVEQAEVKKLEPTKYKIVKNGD